MYLYDIIDIKKEMSSQKGYSKNSLFDIANKSRT